MIDTRRLSEVQRHILSSYACQDRKWRDGLLKDWGLLDTDKEAFVTKYVPGTHYYALDKKFLTFIQASEYLKEHGYKCLGFQEYRVAPNTA
jgi:hypothetical protein